MDTEAQRQAGVLQDLWGRPTAPEATPGWREHGEPLRAGRAAYQGNAGATAERVLAAAYPTVQALLGDEALAALARQLWHHHPPEQGDLTAWGQILPDWLTGLPDIQDWPYVPDCARLDWARHTAEHAGDALFEPASLALLGTQDPAHLRIELRPGLSVIRSDWPVVSLWQAHQAARPQENMAPEADRLKTLRHALAARQAETAVVWRHEWRAEVCELPKSMADWMSALAPATQSPPLLAALLDSAPADFDLGQWLALALHHGWIWRVSVTDRAG